MISPLWSELPVEPLNDLARKMLVILWREAHGAKRGSALYYKTQLWELYAHIRDNAIGYQAGRIWAQHDRRQLMREYSRRVRAGSFAFPLFFDQGEEPWCAAWQMAIEAVDREPPDLPTFSREAIQAWLDEETANLARVPRVTGKKQAVKKRKVPALAAGRQLAFFAA